MKIPKKEKFLNLIFLVQSNFSGNEKVYKNNNKAYIISNLVYFIHTYTVGILKSKIFIIKAYYNMINRLN